MFLRVAALHGADHSIRGSGRGQRVERFVQQGAKKTLEQQVYYDHWVTFCCGAAFDERRTSSYPGRLHGSKHEKRAGRSSGSMWSRLKTSGRLSRKWHEGMRSAWTRGKARSRVASARKKVEPGIPPHASDMYNLYPAIGAVNALRQNYNFQMLPGEDPDFGRCGMKLADHRAEPPTRARGQIARTYKYMADAYAPRYRMSRQQRQLMDAWDRMYPVDAWECTRAKRIEKLQGNENPFVKGPCREAGLWP